MIFVETKSRGGEAMRWTGRRLMVIAGLVFDQ